MGDYNGAMSGLELIIASPQQVENEAMDITLAVMKSHYEFMDQEELDNALDWKRDSGLTGYIEAKHGIVVIAYDNEGPQGVACIKLISEPHDTPLCVAYMGNCFSLKQGQGLGRAMTDFRVDWAKQLGANMIIAECIHDNLVGGAHLRSQGFSPTGTYRIQPHHGKRVDVYARAIHRDY